MRVAIVADKFLSTGFRLAGVEPFIAGTAEASAKLDEVMRDEQYKVIILPESLAEALRKRREEVAKKERVFPIFAIVPDFGESRGLREKELYQVVERAVGAKLRVIT
jgi:vacuolar-type H+-ATPase subunit F/Vma7